MPDDLGFEGIEVSQEIGLRLPDGSTVWPPDELQGRPLASSSDREEIAEALRITAGQLNFPVEDFLKSYRWVRRKKITVTLSETIDEYPVQSPALPDEPAAQ